MMILIVIGCMLFGAANYLTIVMVLNMIENHKDIRHFYVIQVAFMWAAWLFNFMIFFKLLFEK